MGKGDGVKGAEGIARSVGGVIYAVFGVGGGEEGGRECQGDGKQPRGTRYQLIL